MRISEQSKQTIRKGGLLCAILFVPLFAFGTLVQSSEHTQQALERDFSKASSSKEISTELERIAKERGGEYAYDVLRNAKLPDNVDVHLLGHVIGDELYAQEGIDGISVCTHEFRNACSHSIVIGAFLEQGESALEVIRQACYDAPGGKGAYTMCFHGLGHGVLSYVGYELPKAIEMCAQVGSAEYQNREYIECVGGTIMEMQSGVYDPETWREQRDKYYREDDPLYPCNAEFMDSVVRPMCYTYLTPHLYEAAGADLAMPQREHFRQAFAYCEPIKNEVERKACLGGQGKEFVVLAQGRDVRAIESMGVEALARAAEWCTLAPTAEGRNECVASAVQSLFWGGENDRTPAVTFCGLLEGSMRERCADELITAVGYYIDDRAYREAFCSELPGSEERCREQLL